MSNRSLLHGLLLGAAITLAGCGGGGSKSTSPPPPAGPTETEPNDFTPQSLGTLGTSDIVLTGSSASLADVDLYSATLATTGGLYVNLSWASGGDIELALGNASGVMVRRVYVTGATQARCQLAGLPAGTYNIRIASFTNTATAYTLTVGRR